MMERSPIITEDLDQILAHPLPWEVLNGQTVLVTGAAGMLAAYMVETLLRRNETLSRKTDKTHVVALVRSEERAKKRFGAYADRDDLHYVVQDVVKPIAPATLERGADFLIHAASPATPKTYGTYPVDTIGANVSGTQNILELALRSKAQAVLYFSTSEVYGDVSQLKSYDQTSDSVRISEDNYGYLDPTLVRSCYAESKRLGETLCVSYAKQYGVPVRMVRPFHTYGPGVALDDGRVFADFINDIIANRDIVMKSDGSAVRAFCYNSDACAGFFTALLRGKDATAYNVGNPGESTSIRNLAELLVGLYPSQKLQARFEQRTSSENYLPSPVNYSSPNIERLQQLGWSPTVTLAQGFRRTIEWCRTAMPV